MSQSEYAQEPSIGHPFTIGVLHLDLHFPGCLSLKEKRGRLAKVMNHLRKKHPIVISEVGDHDIWGRTGLAAVTLSSNRDLANKILEAVVDTISNDQDEELLHYEIELLSS